MFLTFTPNPCFERTLRLDPFPLGQTRRVASDETFVSAGGKGLNAARVAARFGAPVLATGPVGQFQFDALRELAGSEGVATDFVAVAADTRLCLNFLHGAGQKTEIIEAGTPFSSAEGARLLEKWRDRLPQARLAAIGGSYAPGAPDPWHAARLCQLASESGVPVIYDGRGAEFERALGSKNPPWAIKPNLEEAAATLGRTLETPADERRAVRDFLGRGVEVVLLSCGERGLYVGERGGIEWFEAPRVEVVSAVGSGDALVGAFAARWLQNGDVFEAAQWGVAAGSANAAAPKPAFVGPQEALPFLPLVKRSTHEIASWPQIDTLSAS